MLNKKIIAYPTVWLDPKTDMVVLT